MRLDNSNSWDLFGFDVRHLGRYWMAAWRDLLWSYDSPIRHHLDEVVTLRNAEGSRNFQAGKACGSPIESECAAVLIPDELVLNKRITVPVQAESELDSMLALEVRSSSPFAESDTRWGWSVLSRGEASIEIALAIVSASAVMTFVGREYQSHDSLAQEVWVEVEGVMVVLQGFGEGLRESRYKKRLQHSGILVFTIALLLVAMLGVAAFFKSAQLQRIERLTAATSSASRQASEFRGVLTVANETISAANEVVSAYPNPHVEIARLTQLLDDDAYITSISISGPEISLRGRAMNAAEIMSQLTDQPVYVDITPGPVIRMSDNWEQFNLNISIDTGLSK
ncbi:MAG: PilN domain-containing protein [Pseudomonadota bacterium]